MRILVTRPAFLADPLCQKMKTLGFVPERFPVMEIVPTPDQTLLIEQIRKLTQADQAIFTSRSAAQYGGQAILDCWMQFPALLYFAMGPGTQQTLRQLGCSKVLIASPPFESESLLAHPDLQIVQGKTILIFQGKDGRSLLLDTLMKRSARVIQVECYQRKLPVIDSIKQEAAWRKHPIEGILLTSLEGLKNLVTLSGQAQWARFQQLPFVVVGARLQKEAQSLGIQQMVVTEAADDATLIQALIEMKKEMRKRKTL